MHAKKGRRVHVDVQPFQGRGRTTHPAVVLRRDLLAVINGVGHDQPCTVVVLVMVRVYHRIPSEVTNREVANRRASAIFIRVMIDCTFLAAWFQQHQGEGHQQGLC